MRVISQSGKYDFPYENIVLERMGDSNSIFACIGTGAPYEVARYSSAEKAKKAMEMCRKNYSNYFMMRAIFQFPADEDVEVEDVET